MRIECPECNALAETQIISADAITVRFVCSVCEVGFVQPVESAVPTSSQHGQEAESTGVRCPKCDAEVPLKTNACTACGLAASRFASYESSSEGQEQGKDLSISWDRLMTDWENRSAHQRFINDVVASGDFRAGAAKYRDAASDPSKQRQCEKMLQSIQKMATAALMSSPPTLEDEDEPYSRVMIMLVLLVVLAGVGAIYAMMQTSGSDRDGKPGVRSPNSVPRKLPSTMGR